MKTNGVPGEFAFRAIYRSLPTLNWEISTGYFFNQKEVSTYINHHKESGYPDFEMVWPIEIQDRDMIYVPAQEELE